MAFDFSSLALYGRHHWEPHFINKGLILRWLAIYLKRHALNPFLSGAKAKAIEIRKEKFLMWIRENEQRINCKKKKYFKERN